MQYNYCQDKDEFVENPTGKEGGSLTGNRVWIDDVEQQSSDLPGIGPYLMPRFKVEFDDFGYMVAAFNRLVQRVVPTFVFPETKYTGIPVTIAGGAKGVLLSSTPDAEGYYTVRLTGNKETVKVQSICYQDAPANRKMVEA